MLAACREAIIFGGNYFTDKLPVGEHWLIWDKQNTMPSFSDCELAWTNIDKKSVKRLVFESNGLIGFKEERVHPTQKPVPVMAWCLARVPHAKSVLDPFMGSGSTGVACIETGRRFIGIERDPAYFEIACKRIAAAHDAPMLFNPETAEVGPGA